MVLANIPNWIGRTLCLENGKEITVLDSGILRSKDTRYDDQRVVGL